MSSANLIRLRIARTDLDQSLRQPLHLAYRHQHYTPLRHALLARECWFDGPALLSSSAHPDARLTVWDASSSRLTLFIMLLAVVIFLPIVLAYTGFVMRVMRGRGRLDDVKRHQALY
jgi:Cytochrome bd terminal oxidase subunit II